MSRKSLKTKEKRTVKATAGVSRMRKRSVVLFNDVDSTSAKDTVLLYRIVFNTKQASILALLFCTCFLSQPFQNVYANEAAMAEAEVVPSPVVVVEEVEPIVIEPAEPISTSDIIDEVVNDEQINQDPTVLPVEESTTDQTNSVQEPTELASIQTPSDETELVDPLLTPPIVDDGVDESDQLNVTSGEASLVSIESATTSDSEGQFIQNIHVVATVESDSAYSFSRDECTRIENGSFYCHDRKNQTVLDDTLMAAPDADGDLEIYLVRDGEQMQITNNRFDDASPYYDASSNTIVWHRLINDRYQIIAYNPDNGEELQLTMGGVNNMEPTRQGEITVWQRWVEDNWEIILYDGVQELQITNSKDHDTAPHIRGSLIIWNSRTQSGEQTLKTYDIEHKSFTTIADSDGVSVSNPRMMVMYEAVYENGDVVMKGFDLVTGEVISLASVPRELPEEIPDTDTTGETRALIQNKPSLRDSTVTSTDTASSSPPLPELDPGTLDLRTEVVSTTSTVELDAFEDIPVLVIPPLTEGE